MGAVVGRESAGSSRELSLRAILAIVVGLKLAACASFASGWWSGPFEERYAGYVYVGEGHHYKQARKIESSFLERLAPFDGQWYREIASEGYTLERTADGGWSSYAFFPAFPAACVLVGSTGVGLLAGGVILNQLLSIASGLLLFRVARRVARSDASALLAVGCFFLYPTAGFLNLLYSESLFVFLLLAHVILYERGQTAAACALGLLLGLCRPQGVLLLFWHVGKLAEDPAALKRALLAGSSPLIGFLLFWGYISWCTGSPTSLFELQTTWGRHGDLQGVVDDLTEESHGFSGWLVIVSLLVATLALTITTRVTGSLAWTLLSLSMIAVPLATGSTTSLARFLLPNLSQHIVLGVALRGRPVLQFLVLGSFAALQGAANVQLVNWKWVA